MKSYAWLLFLFLRFVAVEGFSPRSFSQEAVSDKPFDVGIRVGEKIPPFRLTSQTGNELDLKPAVEVIPNSSTAPKKH